ncbi:ATP-dependent RNA helicase RhlB [Pseudomaricurvus sp.]|uniref:ATP-dependent RNA helicase RhlB n=1 Tax=Pseudomaricurvus sp. TaxID=2004510 RepID=UPI003F6B024B
MIGKLFRKITGGNSGANSGARNGSEKSAAKASNRQKTDAPKGGGKSPAGAKPNTGGKSSNRGQNAAKKSGGKSQHPHGGKRHHQRQKESPKVEQAPWTLDEFKVPPVEGKTRFHDLDLPLELMHGIADLGFEYCSPIQAQSLPLTLNGHDMVGKAQTGTGKTAAFLVSTIDDLLKHPVEGERYAGEARALIIAPTRELVIQIADDAKLLTKYTDLKVHTLVGGMDYGKQQRHLQEDLVDILVATPGRLLDFCGNQDVYLDQVEVLIIDEADRMLDMGFIPQVKRIIRQTPKKTHRQTLLFSATFTDDVLTLADQWTEEPKRIEIEPESVATDTVTQHIFLSSTEEKYTLLYNILNQDDVDSLIVFANRRDECRKLHEKLERHGFAAGLLSGEIAQNRRVKTLDGFKSGKLKVLVATDVAGRGIHIDGISHVVNFTLPEEPEDYIHRIGRTGRAGKTGTSISFACEDDAFRLMPIQELVGDHLKCEQPPEELLAETPAMAPRKKSAEGDRDGRSRSGGQHRSGGRSGGGGQSGGGGRSGGRSGDGRRHSSPRR